MDYISGWCTSKRRLEGCTIIVTGCNTGIGKETALDFYRRGAQVIMACRNLEKANAAKKDIEEQSGSKESSGELIVEKLDLCNLRSVREFALRMTSSHRRITALVCNAGVMMCPEGRTEDGFETHIGSNHLAHALLALLLLPTLVRSAPTRIVFVASLVHKIHDLDMNDLNCERKPYNRFEAYCRSKAANVMFAKALADKLKDNNIYNVTTYSLHPGMVNTDISRYFNEGFFYSASFLFNYVFSWFMKSPKCGAQTSIYCAIDDTSGHESGLYYSDCQTTSPSEQCQNSLQTAQLWDVTIKALKLNLIKYNPFGDENATEDAFI